MWRCGMRGNIQNGRFLTFMSIYLLASIMPIIFFNVLAQSSENVKGISNYTDHSQSGIEILVALIAAIALLIGYLIQRKNELKLKIAEKKKAAYAEFLKDFTETAVAIMHDKKVDEIDSDRQRILARNQLLLYANDGVIKAYDNWIKYTDENPERHGDDTDVELFGKLILEIRRDILEGKTKLTVEEINNLNPFYRG